MANTNLYSKISARYAQGLLTTANSKNCLTAIESNIEKILKVLNQTPQLTEFLSNPRILRQEKKDFISNTLVPGLKLNEYTTNLLFLIIDRNHINSLNSICETFVKLVQKIQKSQTVKLITFVPLGWRQEKILEKKIKDATGAKKVKLLAADPDKSLLGGFIIEIGSKRLDLSLQGSLKRLADYFGIRFVG